MYKLRKDSLSQEINGVLRIADNAFIPLNAPDNTDYIAYLKWMEEGNVPTPADE